MSKLHLVFPQKKGIEDDGKYKIKSNFGYEHYHRVGFFWFNAMAFKTIVKKLGAAIMVK